MRQDEKELYSGQSSLSDADLINTGSARKERIRFKISKPEFEAGELLRFGTLEVTAQEHIHGDASHSGGAKVECSTSKRERDERKDICDELGNPTRKCRKANKFKIGR